MNVRNREADVRKIRSNVLQEFLKMVIKDGWRQNLIDKANQLEKSNSKHKRPYLAARDEMREIGEENYSIDKMDVTLISGILLFCPNISTIEKETRDALKALREDRNITGHSHDNEDEEELYLRYILALYDLKRFIRTVDKNEKSIDDNKRLEFRRKFVMEINSLIDLLDDERIELVKNHKDIEKHIQKILSSKDPIGEYSRIHSLYFEKARIDRNYDMLHQFDLRASDAGIWLADWGAIQAYFDMEDYEMAEKRTLSKYMPSDGISVYEVKEFLYFVNQYQRGKRQISDDLRQRIIVFQNMGFKIVMNEDGTYDLKEK